MMIPAGRNLGLEITVLDPDAHCAARSLADNLIVGGLDAREALNELASRTEAVTFEIERVSATLLAELEAQGTWVAPSSGVLAVVQDKLVQKKFLSDRGLLVAPFFELEDSATLASALPCVWKARRGGYDGRGVAVLRDASDIAELPEVPAMIEACIDIEREFALMAARDERGNVLCYPLTEILMDPKAHVLDTVVMPAQADAKVEAKCREAIHQILEAFEYVGILAVEFFLARDGEVYVNEISPRVHNSGHFTIEACETSQFEQHLRCVGGLPLGAIGAASAAATFNLLGTRDSHGNALFLKPSDDELPHGVFVHDYEKRPVRVGRKLGHVTVVGTSREEVLMTVNNIKRQLELRAGEH